MTHISCPVHVDAGLVCWVESNFGKKQVFYGDL